MPIQLYRGSRVDYSCFHGLLLWVNSHNSNTTVLLFSFCSSFSRRSSLCPAVVVHAIWQIHNAGGRESKGALTANIQHCHHTNVEKNPRTWLLKEGGAALRSEDLYINQGGGSAIHCSLPLLNLGLTHTTTNRTHHKRPNKETDSSTCSKKSCHQNRNKARGRKP